MEQASGWGLGHSSVCQNRISLLLKKTTCAPYLQVQHAAVNIQWAHVREHSYCLHFTKDGEAGFCSSRHQTTLQYLDCLTKNLGSGDLGVEPDF